MLWDLLQRHKYMFILYKVLAANPSVTWWTNKFIQVANRNMSDRLWPITKTLIMDNAMDAIYWKIPTQHADSTSEESSLEIA